MDFIGNLIANYGVIPVVAGAGLLALLVYSILFGGKGAKGGNASSGNTSGTSAPRSGNNTPPPPPPAAPPM